ncbi:sensor histidine kinase [Actinocorallia longicatena]|uniref:Signal transduction histidine kinase subgroup 3 dimerisation and phosphoacceptor domain-containing protein n=1 Tax=Actinocorallia longicatena TaxID=111803 RepID=A0ABP6QHX8_9ACTN
MQPRLPGETVIVTAVVALSVAATAGFFVNGVSVAYAEGVAWKFVGGTLAAVLVAVLQGRLLWQSALRRINGASRVLLGVIAVVVFALPLGLGAEWNQGMAAVAGVIAVTLPERLSIPLVGVGAVAAGGVGMVAGATGFQALLLALTLPVCALSAYATVWLCLAVKELRDARAELARRAVGEERMRFARDLHDVLGHSLQAVALRAELAERLLVKDPDRVARELGEIQRMARGAVQEVRDVVRGYRVTSLRTELDGATAVLRAAGIACETPVLPGDLPQHVHEAFGWVAREAVTNVLRHSGATRCDLSLSADGRDAVLKIVNDGAGRPADGDGGSGLAGLRERVAAVGGELRTGPSGPGTFQVLATVPLSGRHT